MTTIGVAIAVPEPWGGELQQYRVALGDRSALGIPTHITLLPPTDLENDALPRVLEHLENVAASGSSFDVHLRGTGTFRPVSPVVFVGVVEGISSCEALSAGVRRGPLAVETEFPYHPHVTVAHHLPEDALDRAFDEMAGFDCRFTVDRFWLYLHDEVAGWTPDRSFQLGEGR